jgi:hypothetical protein
VPNRLHEPRATRIIRSVAPATVTDDVAVLAVTLGLLALGVLAVHLTVGTIRLLRPVRRPLPEADRAPAGLGRLVPVGAALDQECRRGLVTLELWLIWHRRRVEGSEPVGRAPRHDDGRTPRRPAPGAG